MYLWVIIVMELLAVLCVNRPRAPLSYESYPRSLLRWSDDVRVRSRGLPMYLLGDRGLPQGGDVGISVVPIVEGGCGTETIDAASDWR